MESSHEEQNQPPPPPGLEPGAEAAVLRPAVICWFSGFISLLNAAAVCPETF